MTKQNKYSILIWIIAPVLIWYAIERVIYYIFYYYPGFIVGHFQKFSGAKSREEIGLNIGTFGDMYGGLNSFVSAIASLGAVVAILVQIWLFYQEKREKVSEDNKKITYLRHNIFRLDMEIFWFFNYYDNVLKEYNELGVMIRNKTNLEFKPNLLSIRLLKKIDVETYYGVIRKLDFDAGDSFLNIYDRLESLESLLIKMPDLYESYTSNVLSLRADINRKINEFSRLINLEQLLLEELLTEKNGIELRLKFEKLKSENRFDVRDERLSKFHKDIQNSINEVSKTYNGFSTIFDPQIIRDSQRDCQSILDRLPA